VFVVGCCCSCLVACSPLLAVVVAFSLIIAILHSFQALNDAGSTNIPNVIGLYRELLVATMSDPSVYVQQ
jgi:flagellar biosynthesis protein FliQ